MPLNVVFVYNPTIFGHTRYAQLHVSLTYNQLIAQTGLKLSLEMDLD